VSSDQTFSTLAGDSVLPPPPPECRKGFVLRKGKCVRKKCRKNFVKRNGKCVKKPQRNRHESRRNG
jgi:hypothetical protein